MEVIRSWNKELISYKKVVWMLFIIYMLFVAQYIVFKRFDFFNTPMLIEMIREQGIGIIFRIANFIPFKTIIEYVQHFITKDIPAKIVYVNLFGNIIAFIPMGIIVPELRKGLNSGRKVLSFSLKIIISIEVIQLLLFVGTFDIDDVILNGTGVIIGYLLNIQCWKLLGMLMKLNNSEVI